MSKLPRSKSSKEPPKSGGIPRPSSSFRPGASSTIRGPPCATASTTREVTTSTARGAPTAPKKQGNLKKAARNVQYALPPLSVFKKPPTDTKMLEKMRKETRKRNIPEGEDLKKIKEILRGMKDEEITVHEFVGLVAPYTGDNGTVLRTVLAAELGAFRILARKVYDTMTRDVSDVLTNEHIQLAESSRERHAQYSDKMMRAIDEIYEYCPNFNFEKYYTDSNYLDSVFPLVKEPIITEDEQQLLLRQEAYHRLMWLRSEGDRLNEENTRLQGRLHELKGRQREEMQRVTEIEQEHEQRRQRLEQAQEDLQNKLEDMNNIVEKTMVQEERAMREDEGVLPDVKKKGPKKRPKLRVRGPENWNLKAATEIEEKTTSEALVAESSRVTVASSKSSTKTTGARKKVKSKSLFKKPPRVTQETSPFHYSPPKTPQASCQPCQSGRQTSPFHYSPPRTPPEYRERQRQQRSPGPSARSPPQLETTRVQASNTVLEEAPTTAAPRQRRGQAPRDSWGGYY